LKPTEFHSQKIPFSFLWTCLTFKLRDLFWNNLTGGGGSQTRLILRYSRPGQRPKVRRSPGQGYWVHMLLVMWTQLLMICWRRYKNNPNRTALSLRLSVCVLTTGWAKRFLWHLVLVNVNL
jgi:hypothetical protein